METQLVIALVEAGAELIKTLVPIVQELEQVSGSEDEGQIKAALASIQGANDLLSDQVQSLLRGKPG